MRAKKVRNLKKKEKLEDSEGERLFEGVENENHEGKNGRGEIRGIVDSTGEEENEEGEKIEDRDDCSDGLKLRYENEVVVEEVANEEVEKPVANYTIELPSEGEKGDFEKAVVPYNLITAMNRLSLKRRLEEHEGEKAVKRKRVMVDKEVNEKAKQDRIRTAGVRKRKVTKENSEMLMKRKVEELGNLFEVQVEEIAQEQMGSSGWPLTTIGDK